MSLQQQNLNYVRLLLKHHDALLFYILDINKNVLEQDQNVSMELTKSKKVMRL